MIHEKIKSRRKGQYVCTYADCGKILNRLDHLKRHEKSHDPNQKLYCSWPGCKQLFSRTDARSKHIRRHAELRPEFHMFQMFNSAAASSEQTALDGVPPATGLPLISETLKIGKLAPEATTTTTSPTSDEIQNTDPARNSTSESVVDSSDPFPLNIRDEKQQAVSTCLSPSDLIDLFFNNEASNQSDINPGGILGNYPDHSGDLPSWNSPLSELEKLFTISPNFPKIVERNHVDASILNSLVRLMPDIASHPDFGVSQVEVFLEVYWNVYHPQYPILHRPSFTTTDCNPLLLLSMIIHGANLTSCIPHLKEDFVNPHELAEKIAEPLRWLIFANPSCKPPASVWIIQCMLLLECYEITSSSRELHERAYMYHGTKIQLLRRSPILGGDPKKEEEKELNLDSSSLYTSKDKGWKKWIQNESMKRATFMAFYLDIIHATIYGHLVILYAHQIHLSLPCDDELWEYSSLQDTPPLSNSLALQFKTPKFHMALRKLLERVTIDTSSFGKKILLGGLLSIMFQVLQKDLRISNTEWEIFQETCKDTISLAIDYWRTEICKNDCCNTTNSLYNHYDKKKSRADSTDYEEQDEFELIPAMLKWNDRRCKFSIYHISQIFIRITHYDYIVYAGAPSRMNVPVREEEYQAVTKRVLEWSGSINGKLSVVHAYLFLFEMLLVKGSDDMHYTYHPNLDPFLHRKNIMISAVLVIFAYNFSLYGPESSEESPAIVKEDGYSYLKRIRRSFRRKRGMSSNDSYNILVREYEKELDNIKNKNHIAGLMLLFYTSYQDSSWEVGREYSKLLKNCLDRCVGAKKTTCYDMYEKS